MRQLILDTETTGLSPEEGHKIIEIGCVELIDRRLTGNDYQVYINPHREIEQGAIDVHGITNEFLADKPDFATIAEEFLDYIRGAELVIHNAPFDVGFIDAELRNINHKARCKRICTIVDTLQLARRKYPGQRNSLDALCKRYQIDNSHRTYHGALLDAQILSDVYIMMTSGQVSLGITESTQSLAVAKDQLASSAANEIKPTKIIKADEDELKAHEAYLELLGEQCDKYH